MVSHYLEPKIVGVDSSIMQLQWPVSRREKVTWDGWNVLTLRMLPASFLSRVDVCGELPHVTGFCKGRWALHLPKVVDLSQLCIFVYAAFVFKNWFGSKASGSITCATGCVLWRRDQSLSLCCVLFRLDGWFCLRLQVLILSGSYFNNQLIVSVNFQGIMSNICSIQLLKCKGLLLLDCWLNKNTKWKISQIVWLFFFRTNNKSWMEKVIGRLIDHENNC